MGAGVKSVWDGGGRERVGGDGEVEGEKVHVFSGNSQIHSITI